MAADKPHVIMLLADDFGWANAGWHRPDHINEVQTPNMNSLVAKGIELDRAYSFKFCSPTRCSLQSGRLPTHVNVLNDDMVIYNPKDPVSGFAGIPRNMTGMAEHMKAAGYATHQTGKWDAGMATPEHTPQGRGYDTSLGYFHHANDYWTEHVGEFVDLWETNGPANQLNGSSTMTPLGPEEEYEEYKFSQFVFQTIQAHDVSVPLFYNYDFHIVHEPLEVPTNFYHMFDFIANSSVGDYTGGKFGEGKKTLGGLGHRQCYNSMVHYMDGVIGKLVDLLQSKGMYDDTVIFFQSDNGGPSFDGSSHTANNWPLKGSKMHNHEGGIRVNAWVSGGLIAAKYPHMVGTKLTGLTSVADFYATVAGVAGVDPTDHKAAAAKLPPIDSVNLWPYFTGEVTESPRKNIYNDVSTAIAEIDGTLFKIMVGSDGAACYMGPQYPNGTVSPVCNVTQDCGTDGCLFNIIEDEGEYHDIATEQPVILRQMQALLATMNAGFFDPTRGGGDPAVPVRQAVKYGGFWGPFLP